MKSNLTIFSVVSSVFLTGCSAAPLNFTPSNVARSTHQLDAALISTNVTVASKEEQTGKMNTAGAEADVASLWKSTLDDALVRMALFRDSSPRKLSLIVKIMELDIQSLGYKAATTATYELVDRNTGQTVYSTKIQTNGGASDYVGVNRSRKSGSRSVQANIEEFLRQVEAAQLPQS